MGRRGRVLAGIAVRQDPQWRAVLGPPVHLGTHYPLTPRVHGQPTPKTGQRPTRSASIAENRSSSWSMTTPASSVSISSCSGVAS